MYIPNTYSDAQLDVDILPNAIYADVLARNLVNVKNYVIANPSIIQQLSFLNRAFRSAYTYIARGGSGNSYNLTYTSKFGVDNVVAIVTLNPNQLYNMYRYTANARFTNSNVSYFMNVAFGIANQLQSAKRTILNNGQVCVNCDLLPMIQNPQQLATNDSARVLNFIIEGKGSTCVSGDLYNLECGGSGQAI
jgi:hypothetical protein